tara:strand:+ start:9010 stop:9294 length:285 start_codon:yes stop_codon:yes gene_type:complete
MLKTLPMDVECKILELRAAGMAERQAEAFVNVLQQSLNSKAAASVKPAENHLLDRQVADISLLLGRRIEAESRFFLACMAAFILAFYLLYRLTS